MERIARPWSWAGRAVRHEHGACLPRSAARLRSERPALAGGVKLMALRKTLQPRRAVPAEDGSPNPLHCATSPRCEHHWHYDFRVNTAIPRHDRHGRQAQGPRHRGEGTVADSGGQARHPPAAGHHVSRSSPRSTSATMPTCTSEARPRSRDPQDAQSGIRGADPARDHGPSDRAVQTRTAGGQVAGAWAEGGTQAAQAGDGQPGARYAEVDPVEGRRVGEAPALPGRWHQAVEGGEPADAHPDTRRAAATARGRAAQDAQDHHAGAHHGRASGGAARAALGTRRRGRPDVPRNEERQAAAAPAVARPQAVLAALPRVPGRPYVFTNAKTGDRYTVNGALHVFRRAVERAGIRTGDVTLHTLRHTAHQPDDREGLRRLHRDGDQRAQLDADAGALHAPDRGAEAGCAGSFELSRGHKMVTLRTTPEDALAELQELLGKLVDGRRLELPTSALRTRRSPN